jgi:hypothetical protein
MFSSPQFTFIVLITKSFSKRSQLLLPHTSSLPEFVEMVQILLNLKPRTMFARLARKAIPKVYFGNHVAQIVLF